MITKFLRLTALALVALGFFIFYTSKSGNIGIAVESKDSDTLVSAGSDALLLVWDVFAIALFALLMVRKSGSASEKIPTIPRRFAAFAIDFFFSVLLASSIMSLPTLLFEGLRTHHFAWYFTRPYTVTGDKWLMIPAAFFFLISMFLYFVSPLVRNRQTVGCFIMRTKTTPPFGDRGRFTWKAAVRRVWYEFRGLSGRRQHGLALDAQGRTWYDIETNCQVVLIEDRGETQE
jgi:uncharacterized RDD family membrane protein YckC